MKNKLDASQSYDLMIKIFNHWCFQENAFQDIEEWYPQYITENGREIFNAALAWPKGTSYEDRKEFAKSMYDMDRDWLAHNDPHDEMPDFDTIHHRVLEFVKELISDFMDVKIMPAIAVIQKEMIKVEREFWVCPSCNFENKETWIKPSGNKCRRCKIAVDLKTNS